MPFLSSEERERVCVHVVADHFSLAAAVDFAAGVELLPKYVHEVSHELTEGKTSI